MQKIKYIITYLLFCSVSCQSNHENHFTKDSISSKIERIIITENTPTISFIISLTNKTDKNIVLYGNSFDTLEYEKYGVILKYGEFETPLGSLIPKDGLIFLNANKSTKFIFIYSQAYPNNWKKLTTKEELKEFAINSKLYYFCNKEKTNENYQRFLLNETEPKGNREVFDKNFEISNSNPQIEFRKSMSVDEVVRLTEKI